MAACRGAHHPDPLGVNLPVTGLTADGANGPGRVLEHSRMSVAFGAQTIVDDERRYSRLVQPECVIVSFMTGQAPVAPSGEDDHRGLSGAGGLRRKVRSEGRSIRFLVSKGSRSSVRPEGDG